MLPKVPVFVVPVQENKLELSITRIEDKINDIDKKVDRALNEIVEKLLISFNDHSEIQAKLISDLHADNVLMAKWLDQLQPKKKQTKGQKMI